MAEFPFLAGVLRLQTSKAAVITLVPYLPEQPISLSEQNKA